jgi:hypothetical protein
MPGRISNVVLGTTKEYRTSPKRDTASGALVTRETGRAGKPYAALYRNWAQNSDIGRALVNYFKNQITTAEYDIVPYDRDRPYDKGIQRELKDLFDLPNQETEDFAGFISPILEDLIVLDAGTIEKERTVRGDLVYLHKVDGGKIFVSTIWDGDPDEPRYYFAPGSNPMNLISFKNADMVYMMTNPRTYSPVGLSLFETIKLSIDWELSSSAYNARQVSTAAPDGVLDLGEGAKPEQVDYFRSMFQAEVSGRGSLAIIGGTKGANFTAFRRTQREMQFIEWEMFLIRKMCAAAGVSPQDIGFTMDINKATGEVQQELSESKGTRPVMARVQGYLTREVVWDRSFGGRENNLAFRYTRLNIKESLNKAQMNKLALAGVPWKTGNEARMDEGRQPIGDINDDKNPMNKVLANTPLGIVDLSEVISAKEAIEGANQPAPAIEAPKPETPPNPAKEVGDVMVRSLETMRQMSVSSTDALIRGLATLPAPVINVDAQTHIEEGAIRVDVPAQAAPIVTIEKGAVQVDIAPAEVNAPVTIAKGAVEVHVPEQKSEPRRVRKAVERDDAGRIIAVNEVEEN